MTRKSSAVPKTNALRALDAAGIAYQALSYDPQIVTGAGVAEALGVPVDRVYKTLVMLTDAGVPLLVMVGSDEEVSTRAVARAVGTRSARMAPKSEAERLTSLQTGGIGALALLQKPFTVLIDSAASDLEWLLVNGGRRGLNVRLAPTDLIAVTGASVVPLVDRP